MMELIPVALGAAVGCAVPLNATDGRRRLLAAGLLGALVAVVSGEVLSSGLFLALDATLAGAGLVGVLALRHARRQLA